MDRSRTLNDNFVRGSLGDAMIVQTRKRLRLADELSELDRRDPETVQQGVKALMDAKLTVHDIATLFGASHASIKRWSNGELLPRSGAYREWMVDRIITSLRDTGPTATRTQQGPAPAP